MATYPVITALFAGLFVITLIPLTLQVGLKRISTDTLFGDGGDVDLMRRRAAQSNFTQYVPIALLALALVEMAGLPSWFVWTNGAVLLLGRAAHAYCFLAGNGLGPLRAVGMIATFAVFLFLGVALIYVFTSGAV